MAGRTLYSPDNNWGLRRCAAQHRAKADTRKRKEVDWMSPTGDKKQLCPFTAIARAHPAVRVTN